MISEVSRETEDWSNDAENPAFHHSNTLHVKCDKTEISYFQWYWFFLLLFLFLLYFWANKDLMSTSEIK